MEQVITRDEMKGNSDIAFTPAFYYEPASKKLSDYLNVEPSDFLDSETYIETIRLPIEIKGLSMDCKQMNSFISYFNNTNAKSDWIICSAFIEGAKKAMNKYTRTKLSFEEVRLVTIAEDRIDLWCKRLEQLQKVTNLSQYINHITCTVLVNQDEGLEDDITWIGCVVLKTLYKYHVQDTFFTNAQIQKDWYEIQTNQRIGIHAETMIISQMILNEDMGDESNDDIYVYRKDSFKAFVSYIISNDDDLSSSDMEYLSWCLDYNQFELEYSNSEEEEDDVIYSFERKGVDHLDISERLDTITITDEDEEEEEEDIICIDNKQKRKLVQVNNKNKRKKI